MSQKEICNCSNYLFVIEIVENAISTLNNLGSMTLIINPFKVQLVPQYVFI